MSKEMKFAMAGILKYLSRSALCVAMGAVVMSPVAFAKADKTQPAKAVVAKGKVSKAADDDEDDKPAAKKAGKVAKASKKEATPVKQAKAAGRKATDDDDDDEDKPAAKKVAHAAGKKDIVPAKHVKVPTRLAADDEDEDAPAAKKLKSASTPKNAKLTSRMGKAERLAAEKQARLAAEEEARQERLEAERHKKLEEARRARLAAAEEARQQRLQEQAREKRLAEVRKVKERALEEERLATAQAERESQVRVMSPAPVTALASTPTTATTLAPAATATLGTTNAPTGMRAAETSPVPALAAPTVPAAAPMYATKPLVAVADSKPEVRQMNVAPNVAPVPSVVRIAPAAPTPVPETVRVAAAERPGVIRVSAPARDGFGQIRGLSDGRVGASPDLHSSVAFVMDQSTGEVLLNKNGSYVSPIASISKLMTAVVTMDANLPMDEMITIGYEDVDQLKGSSSKLAVGTTLTRQEMLHLALMASENRAAHALGRTYPGGMSAFVRAMNMRALALGMRDTNYVEPTGLSSSNQSSARDLAQLVKAAYRYPLIRNYTTYPGAEFPVNGRMVHFNNTNRLVHSAEWNIGLQKTGYISEAGRCVVMQSNINGRNVIIVLLDSRNSNKRVEDAETIRYWVQGGGSGRSNSSVRVIAHAGHTRVY